MKLEEAVFRRAVCYASARGGYARQVHRGHLQASQVFGADFYLWRRRFGSLQENEVKRLRELEKENARPKSLLAERDFELDVVREFLKKSSWCGRKA